MAKRKTKKTAAAAQATGGGFYLLRSTAGAARMREGSGFGAPMRDVLTDDWTLFRALPAGVGIDGAPGVEVRAVESEADAEEFTAAWRALNAAELEATAARRAATGARIAGWMEKEKAAQKRRAAAAAAAADEPPPAPRPASLTQNAKPSDRPADAPPPAVVVE